MSIIHPAGGLITMDIKEIRVKSILTLSKLPDTDYVVNPYIGCRFGCTYCYASFMGRFVKKKISDWGKYVYIKINAPELLKKEIKKLKNKGEGKSILFSSVTDPYQGIEAKYKLTRQCLEILANYGFAGTVGILTKSDLVLRDVDILKKIKHTDVGITITSTDDSISRYFEKYAPAASVRLKTMKELNRLGFNTYVFVGPLLPHFVAKPKELDKLFKAIADTGNRNIYVEHINLSGYILERLTREMKNVDKNILNTFYQSQDKFYREKLNSLVLYLLRKYHLHLRLGSAIYHKELKH